MMSVIWTNLTPTEPRVINQPDKHCLLAPHQMVGLIAGRKAADKAELMQALKANGLTPGTREFEEALRSGLDAMKLTREREACTMCVLVPPQG